MNGSFLLIIVYKNYILSIKEGGLVMDIKDNIKALRIKYKLTQTELGKIAGVSDKAVSTWEKGNALPRMGALQKNI